MAKRKTQPTNQPKAKSTVTKIARGRNGKASVEANSSKNNKSVPNKKGDGHSEPGTENHDQTRAKPNTGNEITRRLFLHDLMCASDDGYESNEPETEIWSEDDELEVIKIKKNVALKDGREWFKKQLVRCVDGFDAGDYSNPTSVELEKVPKEIEYITEYCGDTTHIPFKFSEHDFDFYSRVDAHYYGYRRVTEYIDGKVALHTKPKIRYGALRHALEMTLHMWSIKHTNDNESLVATGPMGISYGRRSKFFVDASFAPNSYSSPPAMLMHPDFSVCPTFVVLVAHRHQSLKDFCDDVTAKVFSETTSIQLVLGIKVYDHDIFSIILLRRKDHWESTVLQEITDLSIETRTDRCITLPAEALLWSDDNTKASKDCVVELETMRYVFATEGRMKSQYGPGED